MKPSELEIWVSEVVAAATMGQPVEDNRVELKANWIEPEKAARQLAGHANASRGESILWIVGVDERNRAVTDIDPLEFENWHKQVQKWFDGFAPQLIMHINVRFDSQTVVGLYFETERYSPFVVSNPMGGYPEFSVPWREGTRLRAAKREDLLRLLVPIIKEPRIHLASAGLKLIVMPAQRKHNWSFEGLVYITPADEKRIVLPYAQCVIWLNVPAYAAAYRLWATFNPTNFRSPKNPETQTIQFLGKPVDITPPPPRESCTIRCAETELIADGPGSAVLIGSGFLLRDDPSIPAGSLSVKIEITPNHSERKIVLETTLHPVKNQFGTALQHEWRA